MRKIIAGLLAVGAAVALTERERRRRAEDELWAEATKPV
ncbi:DLW-39 family protein [Arsenicicoccus cauae]|nr:MULTISPECIES: DLW-39 family protein [Arsenicicoccus]